MSIWQFL